METTKLEPPILHWIKRTVARDPVTWLMLTALIVTLVALALPERPATATARPLLPTPAMQAPGYTLTRAVIAYAAPEGNVLGPVEAGRIWLPLAVQGSWVQADVAGSGVIWLRRGELPEVPILATLPEVPPEVIAHEPPALPTAPNEGQPENAPVAQPTAPPAPAVVQQVVYMAAPVTSPPVAPEAEPAPIPLPTAIPDRPCSVVLNAEAMARCQNGTPGGTALFLDLMSATRP